VTFPASEIRKPVPLAPGGRADRSVFAFPNAKGPASLTLFEEPFSVSTPLRARACIDSLPVYKLDATGLCIGWAYVCKGKKAYAIRKARSPPTPLSNIASWTNFLKQHIRNEGKQVVEQD